MWFWLFLVGMAFSIADAAPMTCLGSAMWGKSGLVVCAVSVDGVVDCGECEPRCRQWG